MDKISIVALRRERNSDLETAALLRARGRQNFDSSLTSQKNAHVQPPQTIMSAPVSKSATNEFTFEVVLQPDHSQIVLNGLANQYPKKNDNLQSDNNTGGAQAETVVLKFNVRPPEPGRILTTEEACEILRISRRTIYRYVKNGKLPGFRLGSELRFREKDLFAMLSDSR